MKKVKWFYLVFCIMFFYFISQAFANVEKEEIRKEVIDNALKTQISNSYGNLPLLFIQNNGQTDKRVKFYEKSLGHTTFFTNDGIILCLEGKNSKELAREQKLLPAINNQDSKSSEKEIQSEIIKLFLVNANKNPEIKGEELQDSKVNYLKGNDPKAWKTNIPTYKAIVYKEIYKDIDMKFYGNNRQLEYDIIVKPYTDPDKIKFVYEGIQELKVTDKGDMEIKLKTGSIIQKKPYIYQEINGKKKEIEGKFKISRLQYTYGFEISAYNKKYPLIIDPQLIYSTYLGGVGGDEGYGIAVDGSGNAYITGQTNSANFPTQSPFQATFAGGWDAFVTKIDVQPRVILGTISGNTGEDGTQATFTAKLNIQPTADVTIPVSSSDTSEGTVSAATLTFTSANWNANQTISITGINDDLDDGNQQITIILGAATSSDSNYNGLNPDDVSVTNIDNDTAGITISAISGNTGEDGTQATFTVKLNSEPTADVTISVSSSDTSEGIVSTASLTFTSVNWNANQTVTVTGINDDLDDGNQQFTIILVQATSTDTNYNVLNPNDVQVVNTDNDTSSNGKSSSSKKKGACFITVSVHDTSAFEKINNLTRFRDAGLTNSSFSHKIVNIYYQISPEITKHIENIKKYFNNHE
ncbi:MAG: SBBP repeat-containing protein [Candidatus Firestonebacteria bacterium]|nr:SBBP repeat-containing protein [Candidatus Firestonebacteria bacterium]